MNRVLQTENEIVENFLRENTFSYDGSNSMSVWNEEKLTDVPASTKLPSRVESGGYNNDRDDETLLTEDIRKMARALAPQISELEDVLKGFSETETANALEDMKQNNTNTSRSMMENEDDDLDDELTQLAISEQALREELEFAAGISMLGSPSPSRHNDNDRNSNHVDFPSPMILNTPSNNHQQERCKVDHSPGGNLPSAYTLQDHANYLKLRTEQTGRWYYSDMTSKLLPIMSGAVVTEDLVKDYCLPIPFRKLKRLYSGLVFHDVWQDKKRAQSFLSTPKKTPCGTDKTPLVNRLLQITPATNKASDTTPKATPSFTMIVPATPATPEPDTADALPPSLSLNKNDINNNVEEPLPVRTVSIRVRPDVLCGAIMDAAHHAFEMLPSNCITHIIKRQGGHLRGCVYLPDKQFAYVIDIQLCTQKNDELERRIVLRFYHIQDDPEALLELGQILQRQQHVPSSPQITPTNSSVNTNNVQRSTSTVSLDENNVVAEEKVLANRHLKQTCSLIQRLMAAEQQEGGIKKMDRKQQSSWLGLKNTPFDSKAAMQYAIGTHLESSYKSCPSVREENKKATHTIRRLTLPSLSKKDWPMLDVSWTLTNHIVEELDTRDCSYNTLSTLPFGQFPSLPTLDVQYCSQLRRLSRENMITHLLRSAKELEEYARLAEYNCALCITLLDPMIEHYGVPALSLPEPKSLDEYPLKYTPPQLSCPPWGGFVMEALNKVAVKTPTTDISLTEAVEMIYRAFVKQDDEEKGARLGRKNAQIMERLANMQSHQRAIIQNIKDSLVYSQIASESASAFLKGSQQASNKGKEGCPNILYKDVHLLDIKISLGASQSGRCYVTCKHILFVTSYIPLLGSISSTTLFDLNLISLHLVANPSTSLLDPFPNTVDVVLKSTDELLYSFRPAMGPSRLRTFITIIQDYANEIEPSEYTQVVENNNGVMGMTESKLEDNDEFTI